MFLGAMIKHCHSVSPEESRSALQAYWMRASALLRYFLLLLIAVPTKSSSPTSTTTRQLCSHDYCEKQNAIFEWVESNGGYVNPKVEITTGPEPYWKIRGVFATAAPISTDEIIFRIPSNLVLCRAEFCDLVAALSTEISLGKASFWWPYLSTMEDHELDLPYVWTKEERELLSGLYPRNLVTETAQHMCNTLDMSKEANIRAFQLVMSRSGDGGHGGEDHICMIPLFDAINHAQETYENTSYQGIFTDYLEIYAVEDIAKNQQLFDTFGDNSFYRLFQNYGFHSQYPRLWVFRDEETDEEVSFRIFQEDKGNYSFDFNPKHEPHQDDLNYMHEAISNHLSSALDSEPSGITQKSPTVNSKRYETAVAFRQEYIKAFQMAFDHLQHIIDETHEKEFEEEEMEEDFSEDEGNEESNENEEAEEEIEQEL
jgi:hypothetical protein